MADVSGTAGMPVEGRIAEGSPPADPPVLVGLDDGTNIINAQANAAGALKVASDTAAADFLKLVDSVAGVADAGMAILAVQDITPGALTEADGDYVQLRTAQQGGLWVSIIDRDADASPVISNPDSDNIATSNTGLTTRSFSYLFDGTNFDRMRGDITNGLDVDVTRPAANITATGTLNALNAAVTISGEGTGTINWEIDTGSLVGTVVFEATLDDTNWFAVNAMRIDGTIVSSITSFADRGVITSTGYSQVRLRVSAFTSGSSAARMEASAGTSTIRLGEALPAGSATIGTVNIGTFPDNEPFNMAQVAGTAASVNTGIADAGTQRVTVATDDVVTVDGDVAHDSPDSGGGGPVKIGGRADSTEQADVADGDRVDGLFTLGGKLVNHPYSVPERLVQGDTANITGTVDTSVIAAPGAGLRNYITSILVTNGHATVGTWVNIKDGTTTIYTGFAREDGGGFSVTLPSPLRLTANTVLNAANETTGSETRVSASGFIAP